MLSYAAHRRPSRTVHPKTLALIVAGHGALLFAVMTARGDLPLPAAFDPTDVIFVDPVKPPPPPPPPSETKVAPRAESLDVPTTAVPIPKLDIGPTVPVPLPPQPGPAVGTEVAPTLPVPPLPPLPKVAPLRAPAKALTAPSDLNPPYPDEKRRAGEEAVVRLTLSIDARGRVVAVEPVGPTDPVFLEAARRHILKRWKYKPATEDGLAVPSRTSVSIRFRMEA